MRKLRPIFFWLHLSLGVGAGLVIAVTALTGAILAFEDQISAWTERSHVTLPTEQVTLTTLQPAELIARILREHPDDRVSSMRMYSAGDRFYTVRLREAGTLRLNPKTGETSEATSSTWRKFFSFNLGLHRYLAAPRANKENPSLWNSTLGRGIVSWSTTILLVISLSGLCIWWPKKLSKRAFKTISLLKWNYRGWMRNWNWHNAIGIWTAIPVIIMAVTGMAISFKPFANFIYPESEYIPPKIVAPAPDAPVASPDLILATINREVPDWKSLLFYLPRQNKDHTFTERPLTIYAYPDSLPRGGIPLRFDPFSGELIRTESWSNLPIGRGLRVLNETIHTGEAFGVIGQTVAFVSCLGVLVLIYTGFALTLRRFQRRNRHA